MEGGAAMTMANLISLITEFFSGLLGWVSTVIEFVTANPLLLIFVILSLVSIVVAMVRSWIPGGGV